MVNVLQLFNYVPPKLECFRDDENIKKFGSTGPNLHFEVKKNNDTYFLYVDGNQWMMFNETNHMQACQVFSHYYIANGDVLVTGLGFGIRENWILNNPNVKSLTIIEKNQKIIDYNKKINPHLFEKAEVILCDAINFKTTKKYDTLLLDHWEFETMSHIIKDVKKICDNIECTNMWFWHLETQIVADLHDIPEEGIWSEFRNGRFKIDTETLKNIKNVYDSIKLNYGLNKLPELTTYELQLIITIFTLFFQNM